MSEKIHKSDEEWQAQLSPEQYKVARQKGTERAWTGAPHLLGFHGRALVKFSSGPEEILDIDVTHALRHLSLREFSLHQSPDNSLLFQFRGLAHESEIKAALRKVFPDNPLRISELSGWSQNARKLIGYSRG